MPGGRRAGRLTRRAAAAMGARVKVVEDDASIRRFVALALDELPPTLVECASLQPGPAALADWTAR